MAVSFMRYPGGKAKLSKVIVSKLKELSQGRDLEYREPFFGGGSIGLQFIETCNIKRAWINDKDVGMSRLWNSVYRYPELLKDEVRDFKPSVQYFDEYRELLLENDAALDDLHHGFMKLAIHQISYSGLGTKSGGPLGGRTQRSDYKIDCRWFPEYICKKIDKIHKMFRQMESLRCTSFDFETVICDNGNALIYLDPPYFVKGNDLYQEGLSHDDHVRLSNRLWEHNGPWLLSYDDCPEVRELYKGWAVVEPIDVNYSITATKDKETGKRSSRTKPELLISRLEKANGH